MTTKEILKKLVSIDSQCTKSNLEIVQYIADLFPKKNVEIFSLRKGNLNIYNLIVKFPGKNKEKPPIIFSGHTDTVPVSSKWTVDPFQGIEKNNKITGLGVSDMKAGLAAMIQTALSIKTAPNQDVIFMFDADEENGCTGGKDFLKRFKFNDAQIIICEPTDGKLQIGQKGGLEIQAQFLGKALHSSRTSYSLNLQFNAIHKAIQALKKLEQLEKRIDKIQDNIFTAPTQSICQINGGTAGNVIPDSCFITINRRLLPSENMDKVIKQISNLLKKVDPNVIISITFRGESNLLPENSLLFRNAEKAVKEILGESKISVTSGWTQAGAFNKWGDALILGPGNLDQCHKADEFCDIKNLDKMVKIYMDLI